MNKKKKKDSLKIKINPLNVADPEFIRQLEKNPSRVYEDKRFKKPKYKNKDINAEI